MRSLAITLIILVGLVGTAAAERFEIIDRGTEVEVIADGAVAIDNAKVTVVRERLEIPLASADKNSERASTDATVRFAEVRGHSDRTLSIKLRPDHDGVVAIARGVSFVQVGNAVHVTIPRTAPKAAPAPAPEPVVAAPAPVAATTKPTVAPMPAAAGAPVPAPIVDEKLAITGTAATTAPAAGKPAPIGTTSKSPTSTRWWVLLGGLILVAVGLTAMLRKKRQAQPVMNQLEILATRSLGGKSRIVWLAAGDRELVIAVSPQSIRPLGQWRRAAPPAIGRGFDRDLADADRDLGEIPSLARSSSTEMPPIARGSSAQIPSIPGIASGKAGPGIRRTGTSSPAISGLLRLRERMPTVNEDVATDDPDADAQWAKDLVAAAGGGRR